jgi:preprotein translocase subunit SecA
MRWRWSTRRAAIRTSRPSSARSCVRRSTGSGRKRDPKVEYQREGYGLFSETEERIDQQATEIVFKFVLPDPLADRTPARAPAGPARPRRPGSVIERGPGGPPARGRSAPAKPGKVGRNDPCPCGSGKKYKKCCGAT